MIWKNFKKLALGAAALVLLASPSQAAIQLGFAIDGSGSISPADFTLQLQGLSNGISSVPTNSSFEITVVQFAGGGTVVEVGPTLIDSPATRTAVANQIQAITQNFFGTPMGAGINLLTTTVTGSPEFADPSSEQLFNVITDGAPGDPFVTIAAAAAAQAAGIDGLSAEAVGALANTAFLASIVFPGASPGPIITLPNPIPDPRTQGFVIDVASFQDFEDAILAKIGVLLDCTIAPVLDFNLLEELHTVTVRVEDNGQPVPGREIEISVDSGPNAGLGVSGPSDANGELAVTYGTAGAGVDIISGRCEDDQGNLQDASGTAKKFWDEDCQPNGIPDTCDIDCAGFGGECVEFPGCGGSLDDDGDDVPDECNTPPVASCVESVNPAGKKIPPAGSTTLPGSKGGKNEDGFYQLIGEDLEDGTADVFVRNVSGSATFGPFASGSTVKITEDPDATPVSKPMGGPNSAVAAHIILDSDAIVFAVDSFGAVSPEVSCLVPPPPK